MKVYVVKTLWRNSNEWDCNIAIFDTKDKAKDYLKQQNQDLKIDYDVAYKIKTDNATYKEDEDGAMYSHLDYDYDYYEIRIEEMEVL